ncbi:shikimate kinase [Luminiphilus syltensis NOR5-1B]|uniref:Shikimate kinase n=1 Tax=Luminiphilus syltensis NOR5-1B TaxID=565045 RepID=B8KUW7_9GAMM|nr:shikimate kinase [Luminiphilus syltensis]EED35119.1 shikimate kinase [Luminiphilus syltensis NOR5-1B]
MSSDHVISLIGFPGSGKSTVGVLLAKRLGLEFIDTDLLIQTREHATLAEIIAASDHHNLRRIEEQVLLDMPIGPSVISTGGSVVYSPTAMERLKKVSTVVYLRATYVTVEYRISLAPDRGIASGADETLADIYSERIPLYEQYADITVDVDNTPAETLAGQITALVDAQ